MSHLVRRISLLVALAALLALAPPPRAGAEESQPGAPASPTLTNMNTELEEYRTAAVGSIDVLEFDVTPAPNPQVGNKTILEVQPGAHSRQLKVIPLKKGNADVVVYSDSGKKIKHLKYNVITNDLSGKVLTIRRLLQDIEGISIESIDDKVVIDGELVVPRDLDRILAVSEAYKDVVFNLVTLSKISREVIARRMQKEINDDPGGVNVTVRIINDTFFLFGKVDSKADMDRAETIAQTYIPDLMGSQAIRENALTPGAKKFSIRNMIQVEEPPPLPTPKMVRITYHFVEIGKEYLKSSLFKWVPFLSESAGITVGEGSAGGTAASSNGSFTGVISNLIPKIQSSANGGFSRILFSTVQITEDGVKAELVRQEEIPFIGAVVNGVPVTESAKVSTVVSVIPHILEGNKIRLQDASVAFDSIRGNGAGGKPQTIGTRSLSTIILKNGDSAALAGMIDNSTSKSVDKDPEALPPGNPIFTLLRSKAFRMSKSQFVVFITPRVLDDAAEGTADIKGKILNTKKRRRTIR